MPVRMRQLLIGMSAVAGLWSVSAGADDQGASLRQPPLGSVARQLRLKQKLLLAAAGVPLSEALKHNRQEWESLTPNQRGQFRRNVYAFRNKSPQEQTRLLEHYEKLFTMTAKRREAYRRRARWLRVVVEDFTPQQREQLKAMSPDERARKLLARKAELIRRGVLAPDRPVPKATSAPAGRDEEDGEDASADNGLVDEDTEFPGQ